MNEQVGCVGYAPEIGVSIRTAEQAKYEKMWKHEQYRAVAPGEGIAPLFLQQAKPKPGSTVIDFGAGTGRGALMMAIMGDVRVEMLDFASNCLDPDVRDMLVTQSHALRFTQHDLTKPSPITAQYGYCTDVMEHIPTEDVDRVLVNILQAAQHVFFQISCEDDVCGALIGQPLHLTVQPYAWWLEKLQKFDCVVHWSQDCGTHALFYVSAWQDCTEFTTRGVLNVEEQQIVDNVKVNIAGDWKQVEPHVTNDIDAMILCGGPSLAKYEADIKRLRAEGVKLITTNGTYNWAIERGLNPSAQIIVDARAHNARFTRPLVDGCRYLMASQVDPSVLEGLPKDRTFLWHSGAEMIKELLTERYPVWYAIPGGSTVTLRALVLMRTLGYRRFHMFGFDSCLEGDAHHAYSQPENDGQMIIPVTCGDRVFQCTAWMASQAREFQDVVRVLGDEIDLEVYGDGLIAHMLKTGANMSDDAEFLTQ
jgi:hypothetical protein